MNNKINKVELMDLLVELIGIPSQYFEEEKVMDFVQGWLLANGVQAEKHYYYDEKVTQFHGQNVIGCLDSGKPGPTIYLNGHLDTVMLCNDWTRPPYEGIIEDGKIYGVGALDMKSGCAAIMMAIADFSKNIKDYKGKIIFHFVSDEEGPMGLGTTFLVNDKKIESADIAIITEPAASFAGVEYPAMALGARGGYNYKIKVRGKSAHAANPELGINALVDAAKIICELENITMIVDAKLGKGSNCVINISGGGAACSVPEYAEIEVFRHIVRGEDKTTLEREVQEAIARANILGIAEIEFRDSPCEGFDGGFFPYVIDENNKYVDILKQSIKEVSHKDSNITYFGSIGDFNIVGGLVKIPTILFGAAGENYHQADEYAQIDSIVEMTQTLYNFLEKALC